MTNIFVPGTEVLVTQSLRFEYPLTSVFITDELLVHEVSHLLNGQTGVFFDSALDERIGYGLGSTLGGPGLINLRTFDASIRPAGALFGNPAAITAAWNNLWITPATAFQAETGLGSQSPTALVNIVYTDNDTTGNAALPIGSQGWIDVQNTTGINISCASLAAVYSALTGVNLACPAGIDPAFQ